MSTISDRSTRQNDPQCTLANLSNGRKGSRNKRELSNNHKAAGTTPAKTAQPVMQGALPAFHGSWAPKILTLALLGVHDPKTMPPLSMNLSAIATHLPHQCGARLPIRVSLKKKQLYAQKMLRQLAVTDLEHDKPTLPITNRDNKSNTTTVVWLPVRYTGVNLHALWVDARLAHSSRVHQT